MNTTYNDATEIDQEVDELAEDDLEGYTGRTLTTAELLAAYEVIGYAPPFVVVKRLSDDIVGTLEFVHWPRTYFGFQPH